MESGSEDLGENRVVPNEFMKEDNQAQITEAEANGYADTDHHTRWAKSEECLADSITSSSKLDAEKKIAFLEDELIKVRSDAERQALHHKSELDLAHCKVEDAEMRLLQVQESTSTQIKEADVKISLLEDELQKAKLDLDAFGDDQMKLRSESVRLADEVVTSQTKVSELEEKLSMAEEQAQKLATQEATLLRQVSTLEGILAAAEAKTKEVEDKLTLQIELHQAEAKEMAMREESLVEIKEKADTEVGISRQRMLDLESDLKSALEKADEHWGQLRLKDELVKEILERSAELHNVIMVGESKLNDAEETMNSLQIELEELKSQVAAGAEREMFLKETETHMSKLKQDFDNAQGNVAELEAELKSAETKAEEHLRSLRLYEENAVTSSEKILDLERMLNLSEDKLKSSEGLVETLQSELHELNLSGAKDVEIWKETLGKSTQMEEELQAKLQASENRCQDLELSVGHLMETSAKLEESLVVLQSEAKVADGKVGELELELENLQQLKEELEENVRISRENSSHHENSALMFRERVLESERMLILSEDKLKSSEVLVETLQTELHELKLSGAKDIEIWRETTSKSAQMEEELQAKLKASEDRCQDLKFSLDNLTESSAKLGESLAVLQSGAKLADDRVGELELELENSQQMKAELEEKVRIFEESSSHHENSAKKSLERIIELEDKLKSSEGLVERLQTELHDMKLSASKDVEIWRETTAKSAQMEEELQAKLKASEDRCQDLEVSIGHLTETTAKLEESLAVLQLGAKLADDKVAELELDLEKLSQSKEELEEKVRISEESSFLHENNAKQSLERSIDLEDKVKHSQGLVETLHTELHELKLSGANDAEIWRETTAKSAQLEEDLQAKLKASEDRCQGLELCIVHLTETSAKLEESLAVLQSGAKLADAKVVELELELEKLHQSRAELEEKVRISEEILSHHENSAKQSLERSIELESTVTKHQTELKDAGSRVVELESTLFNVQERNHELEVMLKSAETKSTMLEYEVKQLADRAAGLDESVNFLESKDADTIAKIEELELELRISKQREHELLEKEGIAEENSRQHENTVKHFTDRVTELEALLAAKEIETKAVEAKVSGLELELESVTQRAVVLEDTLKDSEAKLLELEGALKQATSRSTELEGFLEVASTQIKDATDKVATTEARLLTEEQNHRQVEAEAKSLGEELLQLEDAVKQATSRSAELECLLETAHAQAKEAMDMVASSEALLQTEQGKFMQAEIEASRRLLQLENIVKHSVDRSAELEGALEIANTQAKDARDRLAATEGLLQAEQEKRRQAEAEASQQLLQLENAVNQGTSRVAELEELLEVANSRAKDAEDRIASIEYLLQTEQESHMQAKAESKSLTEKLLQLEDSVKQTTNRSSELERLLEVVNAQAKYATDKVESTEALLQAEQQNFRQAEAEAKNLLEKLLQHEDDVRQATSRSSELQGLLEVANGEVKDARDCIASTELLLQEVQEKQSQAEAEASQKLIHLEDALRQAISRSAEFESLLEIANTQAKEATDRVAATEAILEAEQEKHMQFEAEASERLLQLDIAVKEATGRSAELEGLLDVANTQAKDASDRAASYEALFQADQEKHRKAEEEATENLLQLEDALKQAMCKSTELESLLEAANVQAKDAAVMVASTEAHLLAEQEKYRQAEIVANEQLLQLEDAVKQATFRSVEIQGLLEAAYAQSKDSTEKVASIESLLQAEQEKHRETEAKSNDLIEQLSKLSEQFVFVQTNESDTAAKLLHAESRICELELLVEKLKEAETLVYTLNEKVSAAEERANKAEADVHAAVLSECNLKEELSSHEISIINLQTSLSQIESERQALTVQFDNAGNRICELEPLVDRLKEAEALVCSLTEKSSVAEERAFKAEADVHAAVLNESRLREELSSYQTSIGNLELSFSQVENEKQVLTAQINKATTSFTKLNEELTQEREKLQLQMATSMQENGDLIEKVASLQGNLQEALIEVDTFRKQLQESSLREDFLDNELQNMKGEIARLQGELQEAFVEVEVSGKQLKESISREAALDNELQKLQVQYSTVNHDYIHDVELQGKLEHTVTREEHQDQSDQKIDKLTFTRRSAEIKLADVEDEKVKLNIENRLLEQKIQDQDKELRNEIGKQNAAVEHNTTILKSRDLDMDFTSSSGKTRRRKGKKNNLEAEETQTLETKINNKAKHARSSAVSSPLLFSFCVISMVSLCTGFWIARKIYF